MIEGIKSELNAKAEDGYRDFSKKLIPESSLPLLGVRLPALRAMAAETVKRGKGESFLRECDFSSMEMCFLYAYILGKTWADISTLIKYFDNAARHIDNWSTCDILCQSFKQCEKHPEEVWQLLCSYLNSGKTYYMRIAVVMMMSHYLNDEYIDRVFAALSSVKNEEYYYKMAVAWCTATAMAKYRDKTYRFLEICNFDDWTYNKSIQKMIESRRISDADKARLRGMKKR